MNSETQAKQEALKKIVGPDGFSDSTESIETYGRDWTKHLTLHAFGIVFPRTTEEVQSIVNWAIDNKIALVPSGGRTGLSGGATATQGELVVSMERMNKILDFSALDESLTVQAGVITENLQKEAEKNGYFFPVDFASRGSSHIGGNIATNAGGIKVIRYGLIRNWVSSIKVVTGKGEILHLNKGLIKNATGFDLRHLFIGSEGCLGFITEATIQLTRPPQNPSVFVFGVEHLNAIMQVYSEFKKSSPLIAFEMFTEDCLKKVLESTDLQRPFESQCPYYILIEIENLNETVLEKAMSVFEGLLEKNVVTDGTVNQSQQQAKDLWRLREDISEATSAFEPYKNDISVQISKVPQFLTDMNEILNKNYPNFQVCWFGHIGDGNLHINILKPKEMNSTDFVQSCKEVDLHLFTMIQKFEGSISAEHGVGVTKKPYLSFSRSEAEIEYLRAIKKVFDPHGIINPGKLI